MNLVYSFCVDFRYLYFGWDVSLQSFCLSYFQIIFQITISSPSSSVLQTVPSIFLLANSSFVLLKRSVSLPFLIMIKNRLCVCALDFLTYVFSIANQHICYAQILHLSFLPHKIYYCIMSALLSLLMVLFVVFYCLWHIIYIYIIFCFPNIIWNYIICPEDLPSVFLNE